MVHQKEFTSGSERVSEAGSEEESEEGSEEVVQREFQRCFRGRVPEGGLRRFWNGF